MENKYPIASSTWDDAEINAIKKVIDTGAYSMGKFVFEFETKFSEYFNSKYSVMANSGSSANLLAIASLFYKKNNPLKRGDEVITSGGIVGRIEKVYDDDKIDLIISNELTLLFNSMLRISSKM